ncbi:MAG: peptide chain release factor N(5)-glutamine methyltransferase [Desulfohalobiaceae bacterium]|nr:peptide chain release factor N(5)-glutamine methyltransferase [Desulfohalobiaceae bacterium]
MQTIGQLLSGYTRCLEQKGIDAPRLSAEVITARALGLSRLELLLCRDRLLSPREADQAKRLLRRREKGEPLAYILGQREFYGQDFLVSNQVLIPRPETELVIETARELLPRQKPFLFADICTGSGVIGIMLARLFPESRGMLLDISLSALDVARRNIQKHDLGHRLQPACADLASALGPESLDLLAVNPPYIPQGELDALSPEIREHEPRLALDGGQSGLDAILLLLDQARRVLKDGGRLIMEIGQGQGTCLRQAGGPSGTSWGRLRTFKDLSGRERVWALQKTVT